MSLSLLVCLHCSVVWSGSWGVVLFGCFVFDFGFLGASVATCCLFALLVLLLYLIVLVRVFLCIVF